MAHFAKIDGSGVVIDVNVFDNDEIAANGGDWSSEAETYVNNKMGAGLTSDHDHTTSPAAEKLWDKLADTKGMVKKKTAAGNDEFDYEYDNEDEDDDCDFGMAQRTLLSPLLGDKYRQGLATNHSWIMKGKRFKSAFDKLRKQHKTYSKLSSDGEVFIKELITKASKLFDKEYGN